MKKNTGCEPHEFLQASRVAAGCGCTATLVCGNCRAQIQYQTWSGAQLASTIESGRLVGCGACGASARVRPLDY